MAETLIGRDGQTKTIVSDSYAPHGEITGPPVPPDDPKKWHAPMLEGAAVCKRYNNATPDNLRSWHALVGFPQPDKIVAKTRWGSWKNQTTEYWFIYKLEAWESSIASVAAQIQR